MLFVIGFLLAVIGLFLPKALGEGETTINVAAVLVISGSLNMLISLGMLAWRHLP